MTYCVLRPMAIVVPKLKGPSLDDKKLPPEVKKMIEATVCPPMRAVCKFDDPKIVPDADVTWCCVQKITAPPRNDKASPGTPPGMPPPGMPPPAAAPPAPAEKH